MQSPNRLLALRRLPVTVATRSPCSIRIRTFTFATPLRTGGPTSGPSNDLHKNKDDKSKPMPEHPDNDDTFANKVETKIGEASDISVDKSDPAKMADQAEKMMPGGGGSNSSSSDDNLDPDPQQNKTFAQDK
ncbi:hypothetical protein HRR90_009083 [Exophiala dermatitidis]|uniref:Uncharacterized protein n=2 Tax=Exophiala dermatitidis TaxID=5970 RepID=H6C024_EXODN|nr:uncharacterized protein HMPREF1120_05221 [Exophiala dermatitidis NIH/UT8656]KAJ4522042.1 hypothetical protein HRR73_003241 [Exophiala dermatitidis]EHY57173.1 hypothetical protein HMPREF1120_05221 [Exophiala dermatitidis NIH/UT8656]KAJ4542208.1 hypothetical protein HRR78_006908 [Exophiala dermatitidis]KAJ4561495.1 hypothetical protein HRR81_009460 [Exophiala dermatitidis]KAJ4639186.1 hypothetical protein HRR91_008783 [Exophiala dermatitidis]